MLPYFILPYFIPSYSILPYFILPYFVLPFIILLCFTPSCSFGVGLSVHFASIDPALEDEGFGSLLPPHQNSLEFVTRRLKYFFDRILFSLKPRFCVLLLTHHYHTHYNTWRNPLDAVRPFSGSYPHDNRVVSRETCRRRRKTQIKISHYSRILWARLQLC